MTPVKVPSPISAWRVNQDAERLTQTPRKDPFLRSSPQAARTFRKSPEVMKRTGLLPGFQNSFASSPLKPNLRINSRGKGKDIYQEDLNEAPLQRVTPAAVGPLYHCPIDIFDSDDHVDDHVDTAPASDDPMPHVAEDDVSLMFDDNLEEVIEEAEPGVLNDKAEVSTKWFRYAQILAFNFSFLALSLRTHIWRRMRLLSSC